MFKCPSGPVFPIEDGRIDHTIIGDIMYAKVEIRRGTNSARTKSNWIVVQSFRGFLRSFRKHAEHLSVDGLQTMMENIEDVGNAWCCPFADIDVHEIEDGESYRRNSELFEFMESLLAEMFGIAYELLLERQADTIVEEVDTDMPVIPQSLPQWERKTLAFYHAVEG